MAVNTARVALAPAVVALSARNAVLPNQPLPPRRATAPDGPTPRLPPVASTGARPRLSRVPAPRHRQQRLQRQPGAGAGGPRARGAPALPGSRGGFNRLGRWDLGRPPRPRDRRPATGLCSRPLRGLRGEDVSGAVG